LLAAGETWPAWRRRDPARVAEFAERREVSVAGSGEVSSSAMSVGERCGVEWGVCPQCPGEALIAQDGVSRCGHCGGAWDTSAREPCPDLTVAVAMDGRGDAGRLCRSHAECARRQIRDGVIRYDDGAEPGARLPPAPPVDAAKPSHALSLGAFRAQAPVFVVAYDERWPARFAAERVALEALLAPWLAGAIEHIGSTAIRGLVAKPVIDIMAPVASLAASQAALPRLAELQYNYFPYRADVMHWLCKPSDAHRTHHLHLVPFASALWHERLAFRDYLRAHPAIATEYAELKQRLAEQHRFDREAYTDAKEAFVRRVLQLAS
jgi:GrpB-like predicted nucleotidyltransferase (UPF0157 family)